MSAEGIAYVWRFSPYTGAAFAIHLALGDIANDLHGNEVWVRAGILAEKARTHRVTVAEVLPKMVAEGFLERLSPEVHQHSPIRYRFLMPDLGVVFRYTSGVAGDYRAVVGDYTEVSSETTQNSKKNLELKNFSPVVENLCNLLADLVEANGSKRPTVTERWKREAEKMLRIDGRDPVAAEQLIRWSQSDAFWQSNILSMPTFRAKYDRLRLRSQNGSGKSFRDRLLERGTRA